MKKLALILTGAFLSVSTMGAMAYSTNDMATESRHDDKKKKVEQSQLPEEVIQGLEESEYKNWEIREAYEVKDEMTNEVNYELHVASDTEADKVRFLTFSESGEILSDTDSELGRAEEGIQQETEPGLETEPAEPGMEPAEPGLEGEPEIEEPELENPGESPSQF